MRKLTKGETTCSKCGGTVYYSQRTCIHLDDKEKPLTVAEGKIKNIRYVERSELDDIYHDMAFIQFVPDPPEPPEGAIGWYRGEYILLKKDK